MQKYTLTWVFVNSNSMVETINNFFTSWEFNSQQFWQLSKKRILCSFREDLLRIIQCHTWVSRNNIYMSKLNFALFKGCTSSKVNRIKSCIVNPIYNHAHFNHIFVCVMYLLVTICFVKNTIFPKSQSHSLVAQNICKAFFFCVNMIIMREI